MKDNILNAWLMASLALEPGEELFFPCDDKKERSRLFRQVLNEQRELSKVNPHGASSLTILTTYRQGRYMIRILKRKQSLLMAEKLRADGTIEVVSLADDSDRRRRILLMISDGLNQGAVNDLLEPPLSEEERKEFFG